MAAERLALGLTEAGHEVFVVLDHAGPVLERMKGAGVRCFCSPLPLTDKWRFWHTWSARRSLGQLLRKEKPHVIHSNDLPSHQLVSAVARSLELPCVCHHRFFYDGPAIDWFNKYGADKHVFISRVMQERLCAASQELRKQRAVQIYDGVASTKPCSPAEQTALRQRLGLPDKTTVLFAGQIIPIKGVQDLIRAWARLAAPLRECSQLVLVGEDLQGQGRYRHDMEKLAAECDQDIRFTGFQPAVADWLRAADIAVVPSHQEPLSLATLEAMAQGLPVIGADVDGIREIIVPEETGLLVPAADPARLAEALARLIADHELRRRLADNGHERCRGQFSLEQSVNKVVEQYRELLGHATRAT